MTSHYCTSCNQKIDIPPHYVGKIVACPQCKKEFIPNESTLKSNIQMKKQEATKSPNKPLVNKTSGLWSRVSTTGRIGIVALLLIIVGCAIGIPAYINNQKHEEQRAKYDEFIFEADQLANLTSFGVNKGDFTRQLSRVKAKLDSVPREFFVSDKGDAYDTFDLAMKEWKQVVSYWASDKAGKDMLIGLSMKAGSDFYNAGKDSIK